MKDNTKLILNAHKVELINATLTQEKDDCYIKIKVKTKEQLEDIMKAAKQKIRFCSICGKPMDIGFTDMNQYWCSVDCVETHLAKTYDNWFVITSNIDGTTFETDEGDTGIYYKEWNWREHYDDN